MSKNNGGSGGGSNELIPADQQDLIRREAKRRRRSGKRGGRGGTEYGTDILTVARTERIEAEREQRRLVMVGRAFTEASQRLEAFGDRLVPGPEGQRPRWSASVKNQVIELLRLYFFDADDEANIAEHIGQLEKRLGEFVTGKVRWQFATACLFRSGTAGTPGQAQSWFEQVFADVTAFHAERREAARAAREADDDKVPATV